MINDYSHLVSIVESDGKPAIRVDRIINGRKDFYTLIELPECTKATQWDAFDKISETLGKSLCIDSPKIRACLGIDDDSEQSV